MDRPNSNPPAIILGGTCNALSIARSLGREGIPVHAINHPGAEIQYSRYSHWIEIPDGEEKDSGWVGYLLGSKSDYLCGSVLLAASDEALELVITNREALSAKFRLDISNPRSQRCMLNKLSTYRAAQAAGVPTPRFWVADNQEQILRLRNELVFPLLVKPLYSHKFLDHFRGKFVVAHNLEDLLACFERVNAKVAAFLVELIPGNDDKLCSYYTYLDSEGRNLFDFTKRVIRRYPVNMGLGSYHISDRVPQVKELALDLFHHVRLLGIANAEFKLDERDGRLKLMECNARFTAADCLLSACGINLPVFVYNQIVGNPQVAPRSYRVGVRLWDPVRDFRAYRQLRKMGRMDLSGWIRSILHRQVFPVFRWYDPLPALVVVVRIGSTVLSHLFRRVRKRKSLSLSRGEIAVSRELPLSK